MSEAHNQGTGKVKSPREQRMDEIVQNRKIEIVNELKTNEAPEPSSDPIDQVVEPVNELVNESVNVPVNEQVVEPAVDELSPVTNEEPDERKYKVKINGKEHEVDAQTLIKHYQMDQASEEKFKKAQEFLQQNKRDREEIERQRLLLKQQEEELAKRQSKPAQPLVNIEDITRQYNVAIIDGDEEKASKLFQQLIGSQSQTPAIDINRLKEELSQEATNRVRDELRRKDAEAWDSEVELAEALFLQKFEGITEDPLLMGAAKGVIQKFENQYPTWRPAQIMEKAAEELDKWVSKSNTANAFADRVARKAVVDNPAGGSMRNKPPAAPKRKTPSDIVNDMKRARGQPVY